MFKGFTPETVDFLWGIRMNNNREWFLAHKNDYVTHLYEPMKALGAELFQPFINKSGAMLKVSRIYRDARLHHPLPYKESLWICIRPDVQWWGENPCLYFDICPDGITYGFFLWKPRVATMAEIRQDMARDPKAFLKLVKDTQRKTGVAITAEEYKRPPQETPIPELATYYRWKGCIGCVREEPFSENTFGPELAQRVGKFLEDLIPLYDYFAQFKV